MKKDHTQAHRYWKQNLRLLIVLLTIWFSVSFLCGIILVDTLNAYTIGGFPLGFWFAQQGSILVFVAIIFTYVYRMNRLDKAYGYTEK